MITYLPTFSGSISQVENIKSNARKVLMDIVGSFPVAVHLTVKHLDALKRSVLFRFLLSMEIGLCFICSTHFNIWSSCM